MTSRTIPYIEWTVADSDSPAVTDAEQFFMVWHVAQWSKKHQQRPVTVKHISNGIRMYFNDTLTFTLFLMTLPKLYSYKLTVYGDLNTDVS